MPVDPLFHALNKLELARSALADAERLVWDAFVADAERDLGADATADTEPEPRDTLTHDVAFENHPASLMDEPPSHPINPS